MAREGLRTLVVSKKILTEEQYHVHVKKTMIKTCSFTVWKYGKRRSADTGGVQENSHGGAVSRVWSKLKPYTLKSIFELILSILKYEVHYILYVCATKYKL